MKKDELYSEDFEKVYAKYGTELEEKYNKIMKVEKKQEDSLLESCALIFFFVMFPVLAFAVGMMSGIYPGKVIAFVFYYIFVMIVFLICKSICKVIIEYKQEKPKKEYKEFFKNKVIPQMLKDIDYNIIQYNDEGDIDLSKLINLYNQSGFAGKYGKILEAKVDNSISSFLKNGKLLRLHKLIVRKYESHNIETPEFKCAFGYVNLEGTFEKEIYVDTEIFGENLKVGEKMVRADNSKFEDYFEVYCEDNVYALRFITADIMEKMVNFVDAHNQKIELSLKGDKMFFKLDFKEMYNPQLDLYIKPKDVLYFNYDMTKLIIEIAESISNAASNIVEKKD